MTALLDRPSTVTLDSLPSISLEELNATAAFLTRVDRKYVMSPEDAAAFVAGLPEGTRALEIDGLRRFRYASDYLDTPDLNSFHATAHRRRRRGKVRTRTYLDSGLEFLEVKTKFRGETVKTRIAFSGTDLDADASRFVATALAEGGLQPTGDLAPTLRVTYQRSTLLLPDADGRVTLDTGLQWQLASGEEARQLDDLVIVETKSGRHACAADRLLWRTGHRPVGVSKYATGLAALRPELPRNRWHRLLNSDHLA